MCRSDRKWLSYISWLLSCSVSLHCPADDWQLCNQLQAGFSGSTSFSLINYWRHFSLLRKAAVCRVAPFTVFIFASLKQHRSEEEMKKSNIKEPRVCLQEAFSSSAVTCEVSARCIQKPNNLLQERFLFCRYFWFYSKMIIEVF